ncbi:NAD(P)H-dependent oxidoreductase [uncultured Microbacterium sp.]|uniref:FMN-dependent NADH-azoreductase n=1 Tax=uncultured Microbacterium sp. TaxID=191216 RepID=UPI0025D78417|nr:NAD(P)H-dependent oxidoreductase [uncultured Microbacterium sp.]
MRVLHIISSPRHDGASVTIASALIDALRERHPDIDVDTLDVWREELPEFDERVIAAKYKWVDQEPLDAVESRAWAKIEDLARRFREADRIVLGVPMWNWSIPYKLKQLIDLAAQRNLLFTYDGVHFGPAVDIARADVVFVRGQYYGEDGPTPGSVFDHQVAFVEFFLRTIGVHDVRSLIVDRTWDPAAEEAIADGVARARRLAAAD